MSSISAWSYTDTLTIWPYAGRDPYGAPSYDAPYTLAGSWEAGGDTQLDANGTMFRPDSTYYFELPDGDPQLPQVGWYILRGDNTASATPPKEAKPIRRVGGWSMTAFGADEIPDWQITT